VDHIDLNFGCPAPKVTRHGGGAALPWRTRLYADIVAAAVASAGDVPVTVKTRLGIDDDHHTYLEAGRIAADLGVAAVALHARTAEQRYGPPADWEHIARLVEAVDVPVLGNGDIWEAEDARRMLAETGCAGVVIGRGCLGRPVAVPRPAGAVRGRPVPAPRGSARSSTCCSRTPTSSSTGTARTRVCASCASTPAGTSRASRSAVSSAAASTRSTISTRSTRCSRRWTGRCRSRTRCGVPAVVTPPHRSA
jgi:tRNA-dihydrouridine synthase